MVAMMAESMCQWPVRVIRSSRNGHCRMILSSRMAMKMPMKEVTKFM